MAEMTLLDDLKAIKNGVQLLASALDTGNIVDARRLAGLLDYLADKALAAEGKLKS